jgi:hypothetical protein
VADIPEPTAAAVTAERMVVVADIPEPTAAAVMAERTAVLR